MEPRSALLLRFLFLVFALHSRFLFETFAPHEPDLRGTRKPHLRSIFRDFALDPAVGLSGLCPIHARFCSS